MSEPKLERQQSVLNLLNGLQGLEPLKKLFWSELNYNRVNQSLSRQRWKDNVAGLLAEDPVLFASGADAFHVIYIRMASDKLLIGEERPVASKLLLEHPYALFVFSNKAQDRWHFLNVKYDDSAEKRRLFRRITVGPEERLRTASERLALLNLDTISPELFGIAPLTIQLHHDNAFDVEAVPLSILPSSANKFMTSLEVFAATEVFTIVIAVVQYSPNDGSLEQMIWSVKRNIANCVVLLNEASTWSIIYPDEVLKPRVRILPLPGLKDRRAEIVQALCALNAADDESGAEFTAFELEQNLDESFPGATPSIGDLLTDFERIAEHPNEEMRELWSFIRMAGQYPLLTHAQERGEDLKGDEVVPDGSGMSYQQWRLVVHNLRLVVWMARKMPKVGMTLADFVQEGCSGLMIAAKRFDRNRGNRFTTYAFYWVKQSMFRALHNQCNLIRWPVYRASILLPALIKCKEDGLSAGEKSLKALPGGVQRRLWRFTQGSLNPIDATVKLQARQAIDGVLSQLKPRLRQVIERRFGIPDGEEETLESIGQDFGCTREWVRQLEEQALEQLKGWLSYQLVPTRKALSWRESCPLDDASALIQAPFSDFMRELYNSNSVG